MKFLQNLMTIFFKLLFCSLSILIIIVTIIGQIFSLILKRKMNNQERYKQDDNYEIMEINTKKDNEKLNKIPTINRKLEIKDADLL